ncbi:MAG TPA: thioredoxin family protein [Gammaproteobacteria bacterium]|nr:thioredoxin family protein [Gammaproteobacteria bacterium]
MEIWLLVRADCPTCVDARAVWRQAAAEKGVRFHCVDAEDDPEGRRLAERAGLRTFPAVIIDGQLKAVGVQSRAQALALLENGPEMG